MRSNVKCVWAGVLAVGLVAPAVRGSVVEEAEKSLKAQDYGTVVGLMQGELKSNPGNEEAYMLLARALEAQGKKDEAAKVWGTLKRIAKVEQRVDEARLGLLRTRGPQRPKGDAEGGDPFHVPIGPVDMEQLLISDSVQYRGIFPPEEEESRNFIVFAPTKAIAKKASELCEAYLAFLREKFLDGRAWARRVPILIYKNHQDYVSVGHNPDASAGVTAPDHLGRASYVALYMENDAGDDENHLIGTLPHELTHVVIVEFFGAQDTPRWLHEAIARRMEQNRKHYEEAAKTGRDVVAGEYYRFRDLFGAENYPDGFFRVWRFYEQSATIILYLLEQGPESMVAFLQALKDQQGHDEAAAAALGIPVEGAVEELERRWVEWMKERYVHDLGEDEKHEAVSAAPLQDDLSAVGDSELNTVAAIGKWNKIRTDTLDPFRSVGESRKEWTSDGGRLVYAPGPSGTASALGVRMDEEPPMALRFKVKWNGTPGRDAGFFGVGMLDHRGDDTGIQVLTPLDDRRPHLVTIVVADDIAMYVDGTCTGRAPALRSADINEDIDYPLAFVALSPVEVYDVESALIEKFEAATPPKPATENPEGESGG